jgi:hypothetical protein
VGLLAPAILLVLTLVYFAPQLFGGKTLYWGDIGLYFTPMSDFLRTNLQAGRVPLWNPLIYCGTPYAGNPQTWPLYPTTILLPYVSAPYFLSLTVALHVWLAGLGTYLFARRTLGVGLGAGLLAAITFMFGGQLISKEQFPNMVQAAAWLPWVLWTLDRLLTERRVRDALWLGLVLGLQLLAAHVQMTVLTLYLAAAWGVFVLIHHKKPTPARLGSSPLPKRGGRFSAPLKQIAKLVFISIGIAAGLAAGQLLPTLALFRDAARQKLPFKIVNRFFLPFNELGNFVLPSLHGHPFFGTWTARGNFWETCCYVGWLSFGLAIWGGVAAWRKRGASPARFWTGVFMFGLWMALGGRGGLYHLAYWVLPAFRAFHDPARCLLWVSFALSLLAAVGWEKISPPAPNSGGVGGNKTRGERRPLLIRLPPNWGWGGLLLLAFADLAYFGRSLYPLTDQKALFPITPNIAAVQADPDVQAHQARVMAPTAGVWLRFTSYKDFRQNVPGYQTQWADTLTPNLMMPYGLFDAYGYEPVALKNAQMVDDKAAHAFDPKASATDRAQGTALAGALGVKYIAVCRVAPPESTLPGLTAVRTAPTLATPGKKQSVQAWIYLSRNAKWQPRARLEDSSAPVTLQEDGPDQVTLTCRTTGPTRLVLADTEAAGWLATVEGRVVQIETTNGSLRAVTLPEAGAHRVVFVYRPTAYKLGLYLSLLTIAGLTGASAFYGAKKFANKEGFTGQTAE